jgi:hypothetical protein
VKCCEVLRCDAVGNGLRVEVSAGVVSCNRGTVRTFVAARTALAVWNGSDVASC